MKIIFTVLWFAIPAAACPTGTVTYEGVCTADPRPAVGTVDYVKPSDKKPPKDKMPSYQREGIKAATPPSLVAQDEQEDQEKAEAITEGKKAARIK